MGITTISGNKGLAASRIEINDNFTYLSNVVDSLSALLNVSGKSLSGISSLDVTAGTAGQTTTANLITTNGGISVLGNGTFGLGVTASSITSRNGLTVSAGDVNFSNPLNTTTISGNVVIGGDVVLSDFQMDGIVSVANPNYSPASVIGNVFWVNCKSRGGVILDWSSYDPNSSYTLYTVALSTTDIVVGQTLDIIVKVPSDAGLIPSNGFIMQIDNLLYKDSLTGKQIKFTSSYQTMRLVYLSGGWVIVNMNGPEIVSI